MHDLKTRLRNVLLGNLEIAVHWTLRILPIAVCSTIGYALGRILGPLHSKATQQLRANITSLRPDLRSSKEIEAMIKRTWGNYGRVLSEFSVLRRIWRSERTAVEGMDNLIHAKALGRPIIFLFMHLGNWEVIGPKLLSSGGRGIQIYQQLDDPYKLRIAENIRRPYAHSLITNGPFVGKKIYNKLMNGYQLSIAVDEHINNELNTPSFGRPLHLSGNLTFAVRLAKLTNAVLCPVYATRTKGARFLLHILPARVYDFTNFGNGELRKTVKELDQLIDPIIRQHIDQWFYATTLNLSTNKPHAEKNESPILYS